MNQTILKVFSIPVLLLAAAQVPEPFHISVNVELVLLHPAVRDAADQFVSNLVESDFAVFEDGVRQAIHLFRHEDVPVTVGLVIDHSGSMSRKMADVITAARTFVASSNKNDQMFIVNFNETVTLGLGKTATGGLSNRVQELEAAILRAPVSGQTALYDAVNLAVDRLQTGGPEKKVLIVISDGGDNASKARLADVLAKTTLSGALVYAIGIFDEDEKDKNPDVLRRLSRGSGGEAFFPNQLPGVVSICERIAKDIRNQYTLGYFSSNPPRPGAWRAIRVTATNAAKKKLVVRARAGYRAAVQ